MKRVVKKYIIPHEANNHTPHLLREAGVVATVLVIVGLFGATVSQIHFLEKTNIAAVVSPVLVDLTNADRHTQNVPPLSVSPILEKAAQLKADDMASKGYFAHVSPDGISPWHWFDAVGYNFIYAGENLAVNFTESTDVENAWMNSPGHRSNILNDKFTEIGIATQSGMYQGQSVIFVAQEFGKPMPINNNQVAYIANQVNLTSEPTASTTSLAAQTSPKIQVTSIQKPLEIALASGTVKAASTTTIPKAEEPVNVEQDTIASNDMFIMVKNMSSTTSMLSAQDDMPLAGTTQAVDYANTLEKIFLRPKQLLEYAYGFLAALILLVMGLIIMGEYRRHHYKNIAYGSGLLAAMAIALYIVTTIIPHVIVV